MEILIQLVIEYFMSLSRLCPRLFGADDGMQPHLNVHIFSDGSGAVAVSFALQIDCHTAIAKDTVMFVIKLLYLPLDFCLFVVVISLPVFPVVVVGIRAQVQSPKQPANAEFFMMLIDKSVSL